MLVACNKNEVNFTYSPATPRAGETVYFSNHTAEGADWEWSFGDGSTSMLKNPTKVYKRPGTYTVMLRVDNKAQWTATQSITVVDSVPAFSCVSDSLDTIGSIGIYREVKLQALVYNPYGYSLTYRWQLPQDVPTVILSGDTASAALSFLFCRATEQTEVSVDIVLNGEATHITKALHVIDMPAEGVLLRTDEGDFRQRIFGTRYAEVLPATHADDIALLTDAQDTVQTYNGRTFRRADIQALVSQPVEGFAIANRKVYVRSTEGLWVANLADGSYPVCIEPQPVTALAADPATRCLYWAVSDSVRTMTLIMADNNNYTTTPQTINTLQGVTRLTVSHILR